MSGAVPELRESQGLYSWRLYSLGIARTGGKSHHFVDIFVNISLGLVEGPAQRDGQDFLLLWGFFCRSPTSLACPHTLPTTAQKKALFILI